MGTLCYTATMSLDGYAADADGDFQWSAPGDDVFAFHVERLAEVSAEIMGRRTFELMDYWEADPEAGPEGEDWGEQEREFARRWQGLDRIVASSTLGEDAVDPARARLIHHLDLEELQRIVDAAPGQVEIFGPTLAADAIRAGMVSDFHLFLVPMLVGGGLRALPDGARLDLERVQERAYDSGEVYLHLRPRAGATGAPSATLADPARPE
jgi:dihydrofolate reductase